MTDAEIRHIQSIIAATTKIVESWPAWKQSILAHSASPTVSPPRQPVDNFNGERD